MARRSTIGSRARDAKGRKVTPIKGRKAPKPKDAKRNDPSISELQEQLEHCTNELNEALQQQAAAADVLKVIGRSKFDLATVLRTLVESAVRLCDADKAIITRQQDGVFFRAETWGFSDEYMNYVRNLPVTLDRGSATGRALLEGVVVHIPDVLADPDFTFIEGQRLGQFRTNLGVPMLREGVPIGVFALTRSEVRPFTEKQIEIVKTFADQAAIAIENVRLFNETQEALGRQTATAEILKVIAASPADVQPVFDTIAANALRLCNAHWSGVLLYNGETIELAAVHNLSDSEDAEALRRAFPRKPSRTGVTDRAITSKSTCYIPDVAEVPGYEHSTLVQFSRSVLSVPMLRDEQALGAITVVAGAPNAFTERQKELLCTFADQAVIAIQNARQFNDTKEALERQTATADILKVIASSPNDVQPVFEAIAERSNRLIESLSTAVYSIVGDTQHLMAFTRSTPEADAALQASFPRPLSAVTWGDQIRNGEIVQVPDFEATVEWAEQPLMRKMVRLRGFRALLLIPLRREGETIGVISVTRKQPGTFAPHHVNLLQTFADQAVIAIENARLFDEVQARTRDLSEALTYQTGSGNILKVIASSPTNVGPVLETIVENACEVCEAYDAIVVLRDGDDLRNRAHHGPIPLGRDRWPNDRTTLSGRSIADRTTVHLRDVLSDEGAEFPTAQEMCRRDGVRTQMAVPMLREGEAIGAIVLRRAEVNPFTDKQIALLQTFADQAVIAIGNVRLFEEVQAKTRDLTESLQQQTATSEVLEVISSSPGDLAPVFEKMLESATRICGAKFGSMLLAENGAMRPAAQYNVPAEFAAARGDRAFTPPPRSALAKAISTKQVVHVADMRTTAGYLERAPASVDIVELGGARTAAIVPMLRDDEVIGAITVYRNEVQLFSDKQIELLSNFAKQAVIAIENARLLKELRQRTDDLSKSLDDLRTAQDRLVQTEKLASLGQLTAGIAHEIKNPLNFVNNFSALSAELTHELNDVLKPVTLDGKVREEVDELTGMLKDNLDKVVQHGKRADSIVKNMLLHSREGSGEQRAADINTLVDESLNLAYHGARAEKSGFNVTLQRDFDASAGSAELFPQEITRALLNLISNGFYAATKRKNENGEAEFEPTLLATTKSLGSSVEIRIRDNGAGIPPEVKDKMFNPFFTTKPAGEGTGLGLSMTHDIIVKQHGGRIDVATEPGQFTEFTIVLPRSGAKQ